MGNNVKFYYVESFQWLPLGNFNGIQKQEHVNISPQIIYSIYTKYCLIVTIYFSQQLLTDRAAH